MPVNRLEKINAILQSCREHFQTSVDLTLPTSPLPLSSCSQLPLNIDTEGEMGEEN